MPTPLWKQNHQKMSKIFVTGATGTVGQEVVKALEKQGADYTAASRRAAVPFDYADPTTYSAADGHHVVFVLAPPMDLQAHKLVIPFLDYLAANHRPRVVYMGAYKMETLPDVDIHSASEARLRELGLDYTLLRPTFFATNFSHYEMDLVKHQNIIYNPGGQGKTAWVDPVDVGQAVAVTLTDANHAGKTYTLTGPKTYTLTEVAELISQQAGKPITYPAPSPEEYRATLKQTGAPESLADYLIPIYGLIRNHQAEAVTDDLPNLLGRPATDLPEVIKREFAEVNLA